MGEVLELPSLEGVTLSAHEMRQENIQCGTTRFDTYLEACRDVVRFYGQLLPALRLRQVVLQRRALRYSGVGDRKPRNMELLAQNSDVVSHVLHQAGIAYSRLQGAQNLQDFAEEAARKALVAEDLCLYTKHMIINNRSSTIIRSFLQRVLWMTEVRGQYWLSRPFQCIWLAPACVREGSIS